MLENVLADHDAVVDYDSNRHQKGKHGQHVQRFAGVEQINAGPHQAYGNPHRYPKREPEI